MITISRGVSLSSGPNSQVRAAFQPRRRQPLVTVLATLSALVLLVGTARAQIFPGANWTTATPQAMGMTASLVDQARSYALLGGGAGMIVRSGVVVRAWGDTHAMWDVKSTSKSIGSILLGMAIDDGLLELDDDAETHLSTIAIPPSSNGTTGWIDQVDIRSLANHSAGFPRATGGYWAFTYEPKTEWEYSNCGANWLADVLTVRFGDDLAEVFEDRVLNVVGVPSGEFSWRPHDYREWTLQGITRREIAGGITTSVDAMARIGYLCLRQGTWNGVFVFPASYAATMSEADPAILSLPNRLPSTCPNATSHYGLLWWTNSDGTLDAPLDTYFSWGLYESLIVVIPSLDIVAARAGGGWQDPFTSNYDVVAPFIEPIAASVFAPTTGVPIPPDSWSRVKAGFRKSND